MQFSERWRRISRRIREDARERWAERIQLMKNSLWWSHSPSGILVRNNYPSLPIQPKARTSCTRMDIWLGRSLNVRLILSNEKFTILETSSGDERLNRMAASCRTEIMQDLHTYYSTRGVTDYAIRIGELFCLLVNNEVRWCNTYFLTMMNG